ncbi:MAG: hypothetical protein KC609_21245 [Myxococcales bacterium]|nr:hypothetical protein [Myxococcales bacterium]
MNSDMTFSSSSASSPPLSFALAPNTPWSDTLRKTRELRLDRCIESAYNAIAGVVPPRSYSHLLLIGQYGRGDGGLLFDGEATRLQSTVEFLLVTHTERDATDLAPALRLVAQRLTSRCGVDVAISATTLAAVRRRRDHLSWYDAFHGYRVLIGDSRPISALRSIVRPPTLGEGLIYLAKRGSLLLENHLLLHGANAVERLETVQRNWTEAMIAVGDAYLLASSLYTPRDQERLALISSEVQPIAQTPLRARVIRALRARLGAQHSIPDVAYWREANAIAIHDVRVALLRLEAARRRSFSIMPEAFFSGFHSVLSPWRQVRALARNVAQRVNPFARPREDVQVLRFAALALRHPDPPQSEIRQYLEWLQSETGSEGRAKG